MDCVKNQFCWCWVMRNDNNLCKQMQVIILKMQNLFLFMSQSNHPTNTQHFMLKMYLIISLKECKCTYSLTSASKVACCWREICKICRIFCSRSWKYLIQLIHNINSNFFLHGQHTNVTRVRLILVKQVESFINWLGQYTPFKSS